MTRSSVLVLAAAATLFAGAAAAHPRFAGSTPERGAKLAAAPKEVRVAFTETINAKESMAELLDASGAVVKTPALRGDPKDPKAIVLPLPARLPAGAYQVKWLVVAPGHGATPGRLRFEVSR